MYINFEIFRNKKRAAPKYYYFLEFLDIEKRKNLNFFFILFLGISKKTLIFYYI